MEILNHPFFIVIIVLCVLGEWIASKYNKKILFNSYEAGSNLVIIGIDKLMGYTFGSDGTGAGMWLWQYRLISWDFGFTGNLILTFIAAEFFYYATHWYNHNINLGWCTHVVHHSPTRMNLTVGYRLGVTRLISLAWLVFMPSVLLGFKPELMASIIGIILLYQFFIHTVVVPPLGKLEFILNTPSNHRVHHSSDVIHYDKNLGGLTMLFDHLFGTYEKEPVGGVTHYGLSDVMEKKSIWHEITFQWIKLFKALRLTKGIGKKLKVLFGRPSLVEKELK